MTATRFSVRDTATVALQQIAFAAALLLLFAGWLHIPDANSFEVLASAVFAVLLAGVAGAGESAIALRLTHTPATTRRLLLGTGVCLVAALLGYAIWLGVDQLSVKDGLRAGYLNSRLPASMRNSFSYEHLVTWFGWLWSIVRWVATGVLAAAAFACICCQTPGRGMLGIFRSRWYWLCLFLVAIVGGSITGALLNWTPGHGLGVEMFSLVLRLLTVVVLHAASLALLLQSMASAVLAAQSIGTEEPSTSQVRTADIP